MELRTKTSKVTKTSQVWNEYVPDSEQQVPKCPTFRLNLVKCKDENVPDSNQQGTKTSQIPISKDENVPDSKQQGRKRPRFLYNMFGFNAIKCDFWENMRISAVKTKICVENKETNMIRKTSNNLHLNHYSEIEHNKLG